MIFLPHLCGRKLTNSSNLLHLVTNIGCLALLDIVQAFWKRIVQLLHKIMVDNAPNFKDFFCICSHFTVSFPSLFFITDHIFSMIFKSGLSGDHSRKFYRHVRNNLQLRMLCAQSHYLAGKKVGRGSICGRNNFDAAGDIVGT